jgi:hypothetical protein
VSRRTKKLTPAKGKKLNKIIQKTISLLLLASNVMVTLPGEYQIIIIDPPWDGARTR